MNKALMFIYQNFYWHIVSVEETESIQLCNVCFCHTFFSKRMYWNWNYFTVWMSGLSVWPSTGHGPCWARNLTLWSYRKTRQHL